MHAASSPYYLSMCDAKENSTAIKHIKQKSQEKNHLRIKLPSLLFSRHVWVAGKRRTSDLNVTGSRPPLAIRHIRCVLLVNSPNMLNLLSWLLIYLCNK